MFSSLVLVESPAKARTIEKYLGPDYKVVASFGHVRDLVEKNGSIDPDNDFSMLWEESKSNAKHLSKIINEVRKASRLYLATDPDREGEAISWHVLEILKSRGILNKSKLEVVRIMFNEITKSAILESLNNGREVDSNLVDAYRARRALDYLVGYTLSPILWRKVPGIRSAGRVQSVALRLVCEREEEIEKFVSVDYWTISGLFHKEQQKFSANLREIDGKKVDNFFFKTNEEAENARLRVEKGRFAVKSLEAKEVKKNPSPPFITSTLQQEASSKLRMNVSRTMKVAQSLYEGVNIGGETVGLITYMRTDGTNLSREAVDEARNVIAEQYDKRYVPSSPRFYQTKAKNAQEAHEAIRPTSLKRLPEQITSYLTKEQLSLYRLIWQRTMACQMENARFDQTTLDLASENDNITLRAVGRVMIFDGFLTVYGNDKNNEDYDNKNDNKNDSKNDNKRLPKLSLGEQVEIIKSESDSHQTKPPPRYTEASLVKQLESLGIGRPSTYASTLNLLQARDYVKLDKGRFVPSFRGRLATLFLMQYFARYVNYDFTAEFEDKLDEVANGKRNWLEEMRDFWSDFNKTADIATSLEIADVMALLDKLLSEVIYGTSDEEKLKVLKKCNRCSDGEMILKLGRTGPFLSCSKYPECKNAQNIDEKGHFTPNESSDLPKLLGQFPEDGEPVFLNRGPYGFYVQKGETQKKDNNKKQKIKRASLPKNLEDPLSCTLEDACQWLSLPRELGQDPERGDKIIAGIGPYGPYVKSGNTFASLQEDDSVFNIGINRAISLIADKRAKSGEKILASHPDGGDIIMTKSRFSFCLHYQGEKFYTPKGVDPSSLELDELLTIIDKAKKKDKSKTKKTNKKSK